MSNGELKSIPIIAVTAYAEKTNEDRCFEVGMNHVLYKPLKMDILQDILTQYSI